MYSLDVGESAEDGCHPAVSQGSGWDDWPHRRRRHIWKDWETDLAQTASGIISTTSSRRKSEIQKPAILVNTQLKLYVGACLDLSSLLRQMKSGFEKPSVWIRANAGIGNRPQSRHESRKAMNRQCRIGTWRRHMFRGRVLRGWSGMSKTRSLHRYQTPRR